MAERQKVSTPQLEPRVLALIREVLARYPKVSRAILFGSRAKGTAKPYSDIDLALDGDLTALEAGTIAEELEELPLPQRFDVKQYGTIQNGALREHIERVGIVVWNTDGLSSH